MKHVIGTQQCVVLERNVFTEIRLTIISQAQKDKMAEESEREAQLEQGDDLGKTFLAAKIKELQEECFEIRKNTSGKYKFCI